MNPKHIGFLSLATFTLMFQVQAEGEKSQENSPILINVEEKTTPMHFGYPSDQLRNASEEQSKSNGEADEDDVDDDMDEYSEVSDQELLSDIQEEITSSYRNYNISITLSEGVVTLEGTVASEEDKQAIGEDVSDFDGVKKVENNLQVR